MIAVNGEKASGLPVSRYLESIPFEAHEARRSRLINAAEFFLIFR
jgi:hypothetical protein